MVNEEYLMESQLYNMTNSGEGTVEEILELVSNGLDINVEMEYYEDKGTALELAIKKGHTIYAYRLLKAGITVTKKAMEMAQHNCSNGAPEKNGEYGTIYHMITFHTHPELYNEIHDLETENQLNECEIGDPWYNEIMEARADTLDRHYRRRGEYLRMTDEEQLEILYNSMSNNVL